MSLDDVRWFPRGERGATDAASPLVDPYHRPPPSREAAAVTPAIGVAGLFTWWLGPVGGVASVCFGLVARSRIRRAGARRGLGIAWAAVALGLLSTVAWSTAIAAFVVTQRRPVQPVRVAALPPPEADDVAPPARGGPLDPRIPAPAPTVPQSFVSAAPKVTRTVSIGSVTTVDIGVKTTDLRDELARQRADASKKGETILLMTTSGRCEPCRGVDASLPDRLMQTALPHVRLVRVDVDVFRADLDKLQVPTKAIPGFFLLAPDLTPRDGINGGEWGDDVATNIAPVLGPFLRGTFDQRKQPWHALEGSGVRL